MRKLRKNEKMALGAVGLAVVGLVGYFAWKSQEAAAPPVRAPPRVGTWAKPCTDAEIRSGKCSGPSVGQQKPLTYATPKARTAHRITAAVPGVRLTTVVKMPDGSQVVVSKPPETARETEAVIRHIVAPTPTVETSRGGAGRFT